MPRATSRAGATALLLHGDERFLVDEKARTTLDEWGKELVSDFGLDTLEGAGLAAARLQDAVLQAPFLDPYRVVFVRMVPANRAESLAAAMAELAPEVVAELLAGGREDEIFRLTDNLLPHPTAQALDIARNLTRGGMQPTSVAYRMARHIALVLAVKARQERGESLQQVQEDMSEHRFVVQKAFDAAQQANPDRLEQALKQIRDYEWEVKSGQVDAELGLDVLLTRL